MGNHWIRYSAGFGLIVLLACSFNAHAMDSGAPASRPSPVTDTYFDVQVTDPYRWLENADDPQVNQWSEAQDQRSRQYLDGLTQRAPIFKQLYAQISATSSSYSGLHAVGAVVFALYTQPPKQQPMIAVLTNAPIRAARASWSIRTPSIPRAPPPSTGSCPRRTASWWRCRCRENGSEDGTLHVFDVTTRHAKSAEPIPRVQYPTGGGSLAWRADSKGFWYTRYPGHRAAGRRSSTSIQQVYFHRLGDDPAKDAYVLGKDFPKVAEIALDNRFDPNLVVATVANGDGGEFAHYVIDPDGAIAPGHSFRGQDRRRRRRARPRAVPGLAQGRAARQAAEARAGRLGSHARRSARSRIRRGRSQAGGEFGGEPVAVTPHALYLREIVGGPSRVAIFDHDGKPRGRSAAARRGGGRRGGAARATARLLYSVETYLRPPYFCALRRGSGASRRDAARADQPRIVRRHGGGARVRHAPRTALRCRSTSSAARARS